jgi:hypothetical protein
MKKLLLAAMLIPSIAFAQTFSDDDYGTTESACFNIKSGDSIKYVVTCNGIYGFGCSYSMGINDCRTGKFIGASAFVKAKDSQRKKGSFVIRKSGRFYLRAVMGGPWSATVVKQKRR